MLTIDFIGLIFTLLLTGARYPHLVLTGCVIHEFGRLAMALCLDGHVASLVAAGAFGGVELNNMAGIKATGVLFGAPLANYLACLAAGGTSYEPTDNLFNPFRRLQFPFATINFRMAVISSLFYFSQLFS